MTETDLLSRLGIVRSAFKKDMLCFFVPFMIVLCCVVYFSANDGLFGFWGTIWGIIRQPQSLFDKSGWIIAGLAIFIGGFIVVIIGHVTLWRNYSSFLVIHNDHKLVTHGIYRFVRNPIYLGTLIAIIGLPIYAASMYGILTSLLLIPIFLIRIRLEEGLLEEEFQETFRKYKKTSKKLIPLIY